MESGTSRRMRYFSTFSGIGGFELGIQNAFLSSTARSKEPTVRMEKHNTNPEQESVGMEQPYCVGYSEIDKWADRVYKYHFKGAKNYGDITKINAEELPDFDCLVGGFPCQAFSLAGKRRGFDDTRGTLFFDLARILKARQPRLFVFENVKGLLSHDGGRTFRVIIKTITELGYDCQWQVLDSQDFGVPQHRERIIIVGHLRGTTRPEVFPLEANTGADIVLPTLTARYAAAQANGGYISHKSTEVGTLRTFKDGDGFRKSQSGLVPTLPARARQDGSGQPVIKVPEATSKGYAEATVGQAINLSNPNSQTRRGRVSNVSPTIETSPQIHTLTSDIRLRRLTPLECERLQGFPDYWTEIGCDENLACNVCIEEFGMPEDDLVAHGCGGTKIIDISDSQRYKMCGNAVTVNVIKAVFERIFKDGVSN